MLAAVALAVASVLAIAALLGVAGASPPAASAIKAATEIKASLVVGTKSRVTTFYGNIECDRSSLIAEAANRGEGVKATVEALKFEACNCEVKVLSKGTLEIERVGSTDSAAVKSTGAEVTNLCSTADGDVHCIYATDASDLGALKGGNPATIKVPSVTLPHLATDPRCDEGAKWDVEYEITSPKPLYIEPE